MPASEEPRTGEHATAAQAEGSAPYHARCALLQRARNSGCRDMRVIYEGLLPVRWSHA